MLLPVIQVLPAKRSNNPVVIKNSYKNGLKNY